MRLGWLFYVALFIMTVGLSVWHNTFPINYHPDESSKIAQLIGQTERNFRHPPLLLDATLVVNKLRAADHSIAELSISGRWVSALAAGITVIILTGLAHYLAGGLAALLVAVMVGASPSLILYAHYMKEDTLLVMGGSGVIAASVLYWLKPHWQSAMLLAVACVIASLTKYVALIFWGPAVAVLLIQCRQAKWGDVKRIVLGFLCGLIISFGLLGYHVWSNWSGVHSGMTYEYRHVTTGHWGLVTSFFNRLTFYFFDIPWQLMYWPILPGVIGVAYFVCCSQRRIRIAMRISLVVFCLYLFVILLARFASSRYALLLTVMISWFAAMFIGYMIRHVTARSTRQSLAIVVVSLVTLVSVYGAYRVIYQFKHDGRQQMIAWVRTHMTTDHAMVCDSYCAIPDPGFKAYVQLYGSVPPRVRVGRFAASLGSLDSIRKAGVTHVAVCDYSYNRFLLDEGVLARTDANAKSIEKNRHNQEFYLQLFNEGDLVWQHKPRYHLPGFTSPTLAIYRIQ